MLFIMLKFCRISSGNHWVAKSQTWLSNFDFHLAMIFLCLHAVCMCSVTQSSPTFCHPLDCSPTAWLSSYSQAQTVPIQFSCSIMSDSFWPHGLQHARAPCPSPIPKVHSISCPLSRWCHPTISSSVIPISSHLQSFPASGSFQMSQFLHQVAKVLEFQLQHQSFQWTLRTDLLEDGLVGSPCSPRDSQESSPTTQFKSINSSALSFLYSPTLTFIHDYWKNHSFD